jgi:hypothetical protein
VKIAVSRMSPVAGAAVVIWSPWTLIDTAKSRSKGTIHAGGRAAARAGPAAADRMAGPGRRAPAAGRRPPAEPAAVRRLRQPRQLRPVSGDLKRFQYAFVSRSQRSTVVKVIHLLR